MLLLLTTVTDAINKDKLIAIEHILEAEAGDADGVTTLLTYVNGQTRTIAMSFVDFQQYALDAQFAYTFQSVVNT